MPINIRAQEKEAFVLLFIKGIGLVSVSDIETFGKNFAEHLSTPNKFKMFVDLRELSDAPLKVLKYIANFMTTHEEVAITKILGTAILVKHPGIEHLVKLVFTFKKPTTPTCITSTLEEACEFLN